MKNSIFAVFFMVLISIVTMSSVFAKTLSISPAQFNLELNSVDKIEPVFNLVNSLDSDISYILKLDQEGQKFLNDNQVKLNLVLGDSTVSFLENGETEIIVVSSNSSQAARLQIMPSANTLDFEGQFDISFLQKESETNLVDAETNIKVFLKSNIESINRSKELEIIVTVGIVFVTLIFIVITIFLTKPKEINEEG